MGVSRVVYPTEQTFTYLRYLSPHKTIVVLCGRGRGVGMVVHLEFCRKTVALYV